MPPLPRFSPPANLDELTPAGRDRWNRLVSDLIASGIRGGGHPSDSPRPQFFDPTKVDLAADARQKSIFWTASPRTLIFETADLRRRWQIADENRDRQDEYCEWSVRKNAAGKVARVTYTCETPEYFAVLHDHEPTQLLELYRRMVSPDVQLVELRKPDGSYNPHNQWNTGRNLVHLNQANNTLEAAVELAAAATIVRRIGGRTLTAEQELINCSRFGERRRNSDPHIGAGINAVARSRADVTLADPPGLYISDFTPAGWKTPDGTDAKQFWRWTRGVPGRRLRGVYEVPASANKNYVVGDIEIRGRPIEFGAQIADFVSIKIVGLAHRFGQSTVGPKTTCRQG